MDYGKLLRILINAVVIAITILFLLIVAMYISSCGKEEQPMQYKDRMKFAGWSYPESPSKQVGVWIDTETGVCYCGANGKLTMMVDHDGKPFVANGWRDFSSDD